MKDIKYYLPFYLGSQFRYRYVDYEHGQWTVWSELNTGRLHKLFNDLSIEIIQLALRPLSDMTEKEEKEVGFDAYQMLRNEQGDKVITSRHKGFIWAAKQTKYLLKQDFDLFGLIEAGLAIDITKLNK